MRWNHDPRRRRRAAEDLEREMTNASIHCLSVVGTRPNFMKVSPLIREMDGRGIAHTLVHTGQHYDELMSQAFFRDLSLPPPDVSLGVGSGSHPRQIAEIILALTPVLAASRPDIVVVVGDVTSTLAAGLAAAKGGFPLVHVEAGLRSRDRRMPEELNRILVDHLADVLLAPSEDARANLLAEGIGDARIHVVGNVMIDTLDQLRADASRSQVLRRLGLRERGFATLTLHRPSNVDSVESLRRITGIMRAVAERLPVIFPVHPRTGEALGKAGLVPLLEDSGVRLIEPLGYIDFLRLMSASAVVLTDSGGIQEETTVLGVPCLTLRENTERPITVSEGTNQVVGLDEARILAEVEKAASGDRPEPRRPRLWDGKAAERIVDVIESFLA